MKPDPENAGAWLGPVDSWSPAGILGSADPFVQAIVVLLLIASIASWAIILQRAWLLYAERRKTRLVSRELVQNAQARDLKYAASIVRCGAGQILEAMLAEWEWSFENHSRGYDQVRSRILSAGELAIAREGAKLTGGTSLLATIGSIAPFVGLFGTVWGIMGSFLAIGQTQDTSLAVVAPGIAEALMATAVGLFCAIPAVIGYNRLLNGLARQEAEWRRLAGRLEIAFSRSFEGRLK